MTILPQLERDLFNAAEERLRPDATAPQRPSSSPSSFRARLGQAAASLPVILSVGVAIAVAIVALAVLGHGRHTSPRTAASNPRTAASSPGGAPRAELVQTLAALRRSQTRADLQGLQRLDRQIGGDWRLRLSFKQWGYHDLDRRLARVVNIPAWSAKVMIAPIQPSRTSGDRTEGVQLVLWWTGTTFPSPPSLITSGPRPTSVGALLAHGLSAGPVPPGLDPMDGAVHGPDVQDGVLLVPDGVASVKLGRFTPNDTPAGLSTKPLNAALATVHGTATVHDNIAAFRLAIPVYTGRPSRWLGPGPSPRFYYPGIPATAQATWFDARGHVVRRTTTQIGVTMRVQVARPATH